MPNWPCRARRVLAAALSCFLVVTLFGCGSSQVKVVPVEGTVTVGAESLQKGSIAFHPDKGNTTGRAVNGIIEGGRYKLTFDGRDGAPVGAYKVTVSAAVPANPKDEYSPLKSLIADKFSDPKTTPLTAEVKDGGGPYDFKVTK